MYYLNKMFVYINDENDIYRSFKQGPLFFVIPYAKQFDEKILRILMELKLTNRYLKLLLETSDQDIKNDLKNVIKHATNYLCDGFSVSGGITNGVCTLNNVLKRLPFPYNFEWVIYIKQENEESKLYKNNKLISEFIITENHLDYPTSSISISTKSIKQIDATAATAPSYDVHIEVEYI